MNTGRKYLFQRVQSVAMLDLTQLHRLGCNKKECVLDTAKPPIKSKNCTALHAM